MTQSGAVEGADGEQPAEGEDGGSRRQPLPTVSYPDPDAVDMMCFITSCFEIVTLGPADVAVAAADRIIIWLRVGKRGARVAAPRVDDAVELQ